LRENLGTVAAARGWARRSAAEIEIAASLSPRDIGIQVALAEAALRLRHYREASRRADELARLYPGNAAVQRLLDEIELFRKFEFRTDSRLYEEGRSATNLAPGSGWESVNRIDSPPIADRFRILGGFDYSSAHPVEGFVNREGEGGGLEWRLPALTVEATAWADRGTLHRGSARLETSWSPTDHWNFSAGAQLFSTETPLRALLYGTTANSIDIGGGYDWNESTGLGGGVHMVNFSDSNRRRSAALHLVQRIVDQPHVKLTIRPEVYASRNTYLNAPYFNPERDLSVACGFEATHIVWRRYERSFSQHATVGPGVYWQKGYGTGAILTIAYEQIFQFSNSMSLHYGAIYARRMYDGDPVNSVTFTFGLSRRF
jgi:biofilm PGA synthesis protein PgaA